MARVGETVESELTLRPGSVTVIAVTRTVAGVPAELAVQGLAAELGLALGALPEAVGQSPAGWQYVIGQARPVTLRLVPRGERMMRWFASSVPAPWDDPLFAAVHIDWRGPERTITWPAGAWVIPRPLHAVYGRPSWPDGTASEQRERLQTEATDAELARLARAVRDTSAHVGAAISSPVAWALAGVGAALAGLLLWSRR